jgi:NlpC/P60 family putative phage cell wall peptidase
MTAPQAPAQPDIVALARAWIGTPYHHQASLRAVGCDCLGLVRGVWREAYGFDPEPPPAYARDWAESTGIETMLEAANRHLSSVPPNEITPGHVLIFRLRPTTVAKHAAILATPSSMIHAMEGGPTAEVPLSSWWLRRIAAAYAFPALPHRQT